MKLKGFCIGFLFVFSAFLMLPAQQYSVVWTPRTFNSQDQFNDQPYYLTLRQPEFSLWLIEQVEEDRFAMFLDQDLRRPLQRGELFQRFFSVLMHKNSRNLVVGLEKSDWESENYEDAFSDDFGGDWSGEDDWNEEEKDLEFESDWADLGTPEEELENALAFDHVSDWYASLDSLQKAAMCLNQVYIPLFEEEWTAGRPMSFLPRKMGLATTPLFGLGLGNISWFKWEDVADFPFDLFEIRCAPNADPTLSAKEIWNRRAFNLDPKMISGDFDFPDEQNCEDDFDCLLEPENRTTRRDSAFLFQSGYLDFAQESQQIPRKESRAVVFATFSNPERATFFNGLPPEINIEGQDWQAQKALLETEIPRWLEDWKSGKIRPDSSFMPNGIYTHLSDPDTISASNLQSALLWQGTIHRKGKKISFQPERIGLSWRNARLDFGVAAWFRVEDLTADGKPLTKWWRKNSVFPTLVRINDYVPDSPRMKEYLKNLLFKGKWSLLPGYCEAWKLEELPRDQWQKRFKEAGHH